MLYVLLLLINATGILTLPVLPLLKNATREEIKRKDLLPPDHVRGAHLEQDGHINKEYHHEAFLG